MAEEISGLRIIRQRLIYTHNEPNSREIINEYTLRNESPNPIDTIFLVDLPLMLNLEVTDENNNQLPFLPNREVREIVRPLIEADQTGKYDRLKHILEHGEPYFLWIQLSEDGKIASEQIKIIRLKYRERETAYVPSRTRTAFSTKRFSIEIKKHKDEDYDTFVNIIVPTKYVLVLKAKALAGECELTENRGLYQTKLEDYTQVRIPPMESGVNCMIDYDILPPRTEVAFFRGSLGMLYGLSAFLLILAETDRYHLLSAYPEVQNWLLLTLKGVLDNIFEISIGIIGLSIAIIGLVRDPLFDRAKTIYILPMFLAVLAFIIETHGWPNG